MTVSGLIKKLQKLEKKGRGEDPVYYISDYDWVLPIRMIQVVKRPAGWENEPIPFQPYVGVE